jgi:hypothetical protein
MNKLLKRQIALLDPQTIAESRLEETAHEAHQKLRESLKTWNKTQGMIVFSHQDVLGSLPDVTEPLLESLGGKP